MVIVIPGEKTTYLLHANILTRNDVYLRSFIRIGRLEANITNLLFRQINQIRNIIY